MRWDHEYIRTFVFLHYAAEWALEQAEVSYERTVFPSLFAILASIFTLEAFMNHIGPRYFPKKWDRKDENLAAPQTKLRALLRVLKIDLITVREQYESFHLGLKIRKQLTHGRTHEIIKGNALPRYEGSVVSSTPPEWSRLCEPRTARRVFEAVKDLLERLGEASGEGKYCWGILGGGSGWQTDTAHRKNHKSSNH
ncbi:MAG: hypothetical protein NNA30_12150 [Nitrospira sp.]|nr:hypothetical protein [Nitrospira sp.]